MRGDLTSSLLQAATSTFEDLGFLFATVAPSESQAGAGVEAVARVEFTGPCRGILEVRMAGGVLPGLASNMLGDLAVEERDLTLDALGEVANVICGNVVPAVSGRDAVFDLHPPLVTAGDGRDLPAMPEPAIRLSLGIDEGRADLALSIERDGNE